jgi:hypothetical protein
VATPFLASIARDRRELSSVLGISSLVGAVVGLAVTEGTTRGLRQGALSGALISLFVTVGRAAIATRRVGRRRFGSYVGVNALVMATAICVGLAAASLPWLVTEGAPSWRTYVIPFVTALVVSIGFTWWFALDRLLGGGDLVGLITGRYHHPRREERIFLFADRSRATRSSSSVLRCPVRRLRQWECPRHESNMRTRFRN